MKIAINTRKVNLLSRDSEKPGKTVFHLPVDTHLREFTVSVSAADPYITILNQDGKRLHLLAV